MWGVTEITDGCVKNDYLLLTDLRPMFPPDVVGGTNRQEAAARTVRVHWGGESVDTDLAPDGQFRSRAWVGEFFRLHRLRAGDRVVVERVAPYVFHVYPVRGIGLGMQSSE
jgi:hypothetical protein